MWCLSRILASSGAGPARATLCCVFAFAFVATPARGQSALIGSVRQRADTTPVAEADVLIPQLALHTQTDAKGRFFLDAIPAGRHVVLVRRLGYDSASTTLAFTGDDDVKHSFELVRLAQPLPVVPVKGTAPPITNAKLSEFERRRSFGIGRFLTPADMEKAENRKMSDVLQRLPGIIIVHPRGRGMAAYVASSRGAATIEHKSATFGSACGVAIWLDGVAVYRGLDRLSSQLSEKGVRTVMPGQLSEPPFDINSVQTREVAAMEFYAGPAQMPPELNATQGTCGALVIWTK